MKVDLAGKTALVTGAARGLGQAMAVALAHLYAETVVRAFSVLQLHLSKHLLVALRLQNGLRNQALIP